MMRVAGNAHREPSGATGATSLPAACGPYRAGTGFPLGSAGEAFHDGPRFAEPIAAFEIRTCHLPEGAYPEPWRLADRMRASPHGRRATWMGRAWQPPPRGPFAQERVTP